MIDVDIDPNDHHIIVHSFIDLGIADVVACILKANNWPAGSTELPTQLAAMKAIRIEANAP